MIKQETSTQLPDRESRLSPRDHLFEDLNRRLERLVRRVDHMQPRQVHRQVMIFDLADSDWDHGDTNTLGVADLLQRLPIAEKRRETRTTTALDRLSAVCDWLVHESPALSCSTSSQVAKPPSASWSATRAAISLSWWL